jgi:MraZ protein
MSFFFGTHLHRVDKKGRVSVPAKYRAHITSSGASEVLLFPSSEPAYPALFGGSVALLNALSIHQGELSAVADDAPVLVSDIFADVREFGFDDGGRIVLPQDLIRFLGIDDAIEVIGQGQHFEIWRPERFKEHRDRRKESTVRKLIAGVADKLIARPGGAA